MTRHTRAPLALALALALLGPASASASAATPLLGPSAAAASPLDRAAWERAVVERLGAGATLSWDALRAAPKALRRLDAPTVGIDPASRALGFAIAHRDLLGLPPAVELWPAAVTTFRDGAVVRFAQRVAGLPVEGRVLTVTLARDGRARAVRLDPPPHGLATTARALPAAAAVAAIHARFGPLPCGRPTAVAYPTAAGLARPAWRVPVALIPFVAHFRVWVDAETGAVLAQAPASAHQPFARLEVAR